MTNKETRLLKIMLLIIGLGLMFKGIPFAYEYYFQRKDDVLEMKNKKQYMKKLIGEADSWKIGYENSLKQNNILEKQLFIANSNELVAAKVQSVIKNLAKETSVRVESMRLAEFQRTDVWLLVSLSVTIKASAANVVNLLDRIRANQKKLLIKEISMRSYGSTINGTITLVAFSKAIVQDPDEKERN